MHVHRLRASSPVRGESTRGTHACHVALIVDKKSIKPIINFDFVEVQAFI